MAIEWKITDIQYIPSLNGKDKVIRQIQWKAFNPENNRGQKGNLAVSTVDLSNFTNFEDLSEADIVAWVKAAEAEAGTLDEIEAYLNDTPNQSQDQSETIGIQVETESGLPWANQNQPVESEGA